MNRQSTSYSVVMKSILSFVFNQNMSNSFYIIDNILPSVCATLAYCSCFGDKSPIALGVRQSQKHLHPTKQLGGERKVVKKAYFLVFWLDLVGKKAMTWRSPILTVVAVVYGDSDFISVTPHKHVEQTWTNAFSYIYSIVNAIHSLFVSSSDGCPPFLSTSSCLHLTGSQHVLHHSSPHMAKSLGKQFYWQTVSGTKDRWSFSRTTLWCNRCETRGDIEAARCILWLQ